MKSKIQTLKSILRGGVAPAMATPLLADGVTVNTAVIPPLVHFLIDAGASSLFVGGTTGEGLLLDVAQRQLLHEATMTAVNGRVPVLVHVGANRTDTACALAQHAASLGVAAIASVTPTFYQMNEDSLAHYYQALAQAAPQTPLFVYDIPHMAVNGITATLLARLCREIPSLAGIKTSRADALGVRQLIDTAVANQCLILIGNERLALGLLALGADGLISGLSTAVPEPFIALTHAFFKGHLTEAQAHQRHINQILDLIPAGTRIGALKSILTARGIDIGPPLPPRPMLADKHLWPQIQTILERQS